MLCVMYSNQHLTFTKSDGTVSFTKKQPVKNYEALTANITVRPKVAENKYEKQVARQEILATIYGVRFEQVEDASRARKVNKGNATMVRSPEQFTTAHHQQIVDSIDDIVSTPENPKPFWIQRNKDITTKPTNWYGIPIFIKHMVKGLRSALAKRLLTKNDNAGIRNMIKYMVRVLNHQIGIQTFRRTFPDSNAIPIKLSQEYDRVKKGYVLARTNRKHNHVDGAVRA